MAMKFTQVAADAFQKLQLNAGVLLTEFDPATPTLDKTKILMATGGGTSFTATPEFIDFAEDIDNVPSNTMQMKQIDYYTCTMSGTGKTVDTTVAKTLIGAADIDGTDTTKVVPRSVLKSTDFSDIWWVGDYSDEHGTNGGFVAIKLKNALNTGGFSIQSNDNGKGDFSFEFTGHYDLTNIDTVPFELYIKAGTH